MLWRESYQPDIRYDVRLPETPSPLIIGGFSLACLQEIELWRRLADDAEVKFTEVYGLADPRELEALLAPSRFARIQLLANRDAWLAALEPFPLARSFAAIDGMLIVGPSTEDAWEEMLNRLNRPLPTL